MTYLPLATVWPISGSVVSPFTFVLTQMLREVVPPGGGRIRRSNRAAAPALVSSPAESYARDDRDGVERYGTLSLGATA